MIDGTNPSPRNAIDKNGNRRGAKAVGRNPIKTTLVAKPVDGMTTKTIKVVRKNR